MPGIARALHAPALLTSVALALACSEQDTSVTYGDDVRPLFAQRCVFCHQPGAPYGPGTQQGVNIADPLAEEDGLFLARNYWKSSGHPELKERHVVPGQPEESFLIDKIADPEEGLLRADGATGSRMPYQLSPITADELALIEQWVSDGAEDDQVFRCQIYYPIFFAFPSGEAAKLCDGTFAGGNPSKCETCHFKGTPNPPDLSDPFGPDGIVGVRANYRADLLRVEPGSPDRSLLIQKLRASAGSNQPSSAYGAPMPKPVLPLDAAQIETVRQWIAQGARP